MRARRPSAKIARTARAGSWMALLAATTLGDGADTLHAEVKAHGLSEARAYRLVVQSYDTEPTSRSKPVGSVQRAVTAAELRDGVHVNLLELRRGPSNDVAGAEPVVVAWVEAGEPDLEFDARAARPRPGSKYGTVKRTASQRRIRISLNRTRAA